MEEQEEMMQGKIRAMVKVEQEEERKEEEGKDRRPCDRKRWRGRKE